jgi:hypothetical protein
VLIVSMIDARVVDLPDPVGPVTSTSPCVTCASFSTAAGSFRSASATMVSGMMRNTAPGPFSWYR